MNEKEEQSLKKLTEKIAKTIEKDPGYISNIIFSNDKFREQAIKEGRINLKCNKCDSKLSKTYETNDGIERHAGYYGLIDAYFTTGYFSEDLDDGLEYRFSLCEKCLKDLFTTFKNPPDINVYMWNSTEEEKEEQRRKIDKDIIMENKN